VLDGGWTVRASVAVWLKISEVPVKVSVPVDAPALDEAVSVMFCAVPGVRLRVVELAVTPLGRPVMATLTVPVNAFRALALILTGDPAAPAVRVSEAGEADSVKSGDGVVVPAATVRATLAV
jgi:hypothetical protein